VNRTFIHRIKYHIVFNLNIASLSQIYIDTIPTFKYQNGWGRS